MGVVSLFAQYSQSLGFVIMEIQAPFPDATLYEIKTGELKRAEFEYKSINFKRHGHNPNECDLIICWLDNWKDCPVPVLEMRDIHDGEPIEKVYELQEKARSMEEEINRVQTLIDKYNSDINQVQLLSAKLEDEIRRNKSLEKKMTSVKNGYKKEIDLISGNESFESIEKIPIDFDNYEPRGFIKCARCDEPIRQYYKKSKGKVYAVLYADGIVVHDGDLKCKCGEIFKFRNNGKRNRQ